MHDTESLAERLDAYRSALADAVRRAGRNDDEITTIVVTKFHPAALVRELHALGMRDVGENRHQEAQAKAAETADLDINWHFVGQLQGKKARAVLQYASSVHSIDRERLLGALSSEDSVIDGFIQINLTDDPGRGGVEESGLEALAERVLATNGIRLRGVMAVAPIGEEPRRAFARVRAASERLQTVAPDATAISAGMSGDFADAVLEGATHLRIGTTITGNRPTAG